MAGRRGSTRFASGLFLFAVLVLAGDTFAQSPVQPPVPPGVPTQPQVTPPAVNPGGSDTPVQQFQPPNGGGMGAEFSGRGRGRVGPQRFHFTIDPKTSTKELLPTPPTVKPVAGPLLTDDLAKIPEVDFRAAPDKTDFAKERERNAHQLAKINHLNAKKTDAFMAALLENRSDLAGLPFVMGDDCRTSPDRAKLFTVAVSTVRQALGGSTQALLDSLAMNPPNGPRFSVETLPAQPAQQQALVVTTGSFWTQYATLCQQQDAVVTTAKTVAKPSPEHVALARIAALTQMLAAESPEIRLGLVKYLAGVPHAEATKALARMAIFSAEDDVRSAAIDALKVRRDRDYTDVLVKGLRYPLPAVAKRTADAIIRTGRADLAPDLVAVLDEPDPRLPAVREVGGKKASFVREMVRVNHHRNCILCHAPGSNENVTTGAITAEVAVPGQPLPLPSQGYRQSSPDLMIRIDVTYLRQDFSATMTVDDAQPWPEAQRFDFFVRERELTSDEAATYREKLTSKEEGVLSPYHRAALAALREVTGKDTAPNAEAWRKLLDLPTKTVKQVD